LLTVVELKGLGGRQNFDHPLDSMIVLWKFLKNFG
jgi:hypothetical protein